MVSSFITNKVDSVSASNDNHITQKSKKKQSILDMGSTNFDINVDSTSGAATNVTTNTGADAAINANITKSNSEKQFHSLDSSQKATVKAYNASVKESAKYQLTEQRPKTEIATVTDSFEPIDDFLQCHFEPGNWKEIIADCALPPDNCSYCNSRCNSPPASINANLHNISPAGHELHSNQEDTENVTYDPSYFGLPGQNHGNALFNFPGGSRMTLDPSLLSSSSEISDGTDSRGPTNSQNPEQNQKQWQNLHLEHQILPQQMKNCHQHLDQNQSYANSDPSSHLNPHSQPQPQPHHHHHHHNYTNFVQNGAQYNGVVKNDSQPNNSDDDCGFSDYSCDDKYCNINIKDWNTLETCNSVIRCSPPPLTSALTTPSTSSTISHQSNEEKVWIPNGESSMGTVMENASSAYHDTHEKTLFLASEEFRDNNPVIAGCGVNVADNTKFVGQNTHSDDIETENLKLLQPELGNVFQESSTKTSNLRKDLEKQKQPIFHPERPHIHEHFPPSDPNHHYHLHYQNHYNGSLIQHDLILPSNFNFDDIGKYLNEYNHHSQNEAVSGLPSPDLPTYHSCTNKNCKHVGTPMHSPTMIKENITDSKISEGSSFANKPILNDTGSIIGPVMQPDTVQPTAIELKPDNKFVCKWDDCNLTLPDADLNKHMLEQHWTPDWLHQENQNYQCEWLDCMFTTNELEKLSQHIDSHIANHSSDTLKGNATAGKSTAKSECKDSNHAEVTTHVCKWVDPDTGKECGMEFENTTDLTQHLVEEHVKSGKSQYVCCWKGCPRHGRLFSQRQKIIRHLNTHTKHKPFKCSVCGKHFSLDLMLKQHMRIHTGERPYKCKVCGKHFKTSSSLTIHSRIHSGDKPMVCKVCGKRFNESSNLNKHMKIHTRRFKCELCMKSFNTKGKYLKHLSVCEKRQAKFQQQVNSDCPTNIAPQTLHC